MVVIPAIAGTQCASVCERKKVIQRADAHWLGSLFLASLGRE
jgi:hypothetical protein